MKTKDRILEEALTLFAEHGYDGTCVDEIAHRVGIKGPSLYKHFKSKEDILDKLFVSAEARHDEFLKSNNSKKFPDSREEFIRAYMEDISFTTRDQMLHKIRKFLGREQFRNRKIGEMITRHQLDGLQAIYAKIIGEMMKKGLFKKDDPAMLAIELTAPVVVYICKADRQPECIDEILEIIEKHICHFCDVYMA